jgi:hypothetical protein
VALLPDLIRSLTELTNLTRRSGRGATSLPR